MSTKEPSAKHSRLSDNATEQRIFLLGLGAILDRGPCGHVPGWMARNFPEWSEERRKNSLWAVLNAMFDRSTACYARMEQSEESTREWYDLIFWAKGRVDDKSLEYINRTLRHYGVKKLWALSGKLTSATATSK